MEKLQAKVNYLVRDDEKNLIGNRKRLLGFMHVEEELYNEIQIKAQQILKYPNNNRYEYTYSEKSMIVTMGAILFCMYEINGSRFWEELSKKYQMHELNLQSEIKGYISSFISSNSLPYYQGTNRNEYVETIQMQSVIPNNYSSKIIKTIYFMYLKDLGMDTTSKSINAFLTYLTVAFTRQINTNNATKEEAAPTLMTMQLQSIPKSFMQAYLTKSKRVKSLMKRFFLQFDALSKKEIPIFNPKNRFDVMFQKELKNFNFGEMETTVKMKDKQIMHKATISATIRGQVNPLFYILIPQHYIIPERITYPKATVTFYNNQEAYLEKEVSLKEGGVSWKTNPKQYELNLFLSKLSYKISYGDTVLYDSKKELYKDYILFDDHSMSKEVQLTDIKINQCFYILSAKDNRIIFENSEPIISELDYGILYYFKAKKEMKITMNDQVLFNTMVLEEFPSKKRKGIEYEISIVDNAAYDNDVYLNMLFVYDNPRSKTKLAIHLADSYKIDTVDYYLKLFAAFEELNSEGTDFQLIDDEILVSILELLDKKGSAALMKISLKRVYLMSEYEIQINNKYYKDELLEICQTYAKKYIGNLNFSSFKKSESDKKLLTTENQNTCESESSSEIIKENSLVFLLPFVSVSVGFQRMLKEYFEIDNAKSNEVNLLNRFMNEYEKIENRKSVSLSVIDKEITLNYIAFTAYKEDSLKMLGSVNGDSYYWVYTIDLKQCIGFILDISKKYRLKISGGHTYNYSVDGNSIIEIEGEYRLELQVV
ncbi:hypothetical protein [Carnobacterium mobile]|uniref:hypothetical protein n=1 Tax=Carnobacterium mobile TaxID=2750 RepID=UPI001868378D|nr:hypothetical protein [Carnobacterium mobile]